MAYFSVAERVLIEQRRLLREAQDMLASVRRHNGEASQIRFHEAHVQRMLSYVWSAQERVAAEKHRRNKRIFMTAALHGQGLDVVGVHMVPGR